MSLIVRCPAKINTFLSVGPRDERGYHPIRTVFQAVGLFDELEIAASQRDEFVCVGMDIDPKNTVTRALNLMRELANNPPLRIELRKSIPSQAGLGGGSSDAAGLLRAMESTVPGIDRRDLLSVALAVGADVPFFLVGGRARGTGYGQVLEPLPDELTRWLALLMPTDRVSTAEAYAKLDKASRDWAEFGEEHYNEFERVAPCACLDLIEWGRNAGSLSSGLCGSGSAVYLSFASQEEAERATKAALNAGAEQSWVAPTISRSESLARITGSLV